jgi:hypothetical protein
MSNEVRVERQREKESPPEILSVLARRGASGKWSLDRTEDCV